MKRRTGSGTTILLLGAVAALLAPSPDLWGDAGVLIPVGSDASADTPDPGVLSLRSMKVDVRIEGLHAEVHLDQVFQNRTDAPVEAKYVMPLGQGAVVRSFALWQGDDRFPSVVVEKQRGKEIYRSLVDQQIDPGLLETSDQAQDQGLFVLHVAPVPAEGTSRIELTYEEDLTLDSFATRFALPFQPRRYAEQSAASFSVHIAADEPWALAGVKATPASWFTGQLPAAGARSFSLSHQGAPVDLSDDIAVEMSLRPPSPSPTGSIDASLQAYRDVGTTVDRSALGGGARYVEDHGYFVARALFGAESGGGAAGGPSAPRDVVLVLDASLSMQWDKLDRAMTALSDFLGRRLGTGDRFDVVVFNDAVHPWEPVLQPASSAAEAGALAFVRASYVAGGTDLASAVEAAAKILGADGRAGATPSILLFTDGLPTSGEVSGDKIRARVAAALAAVPARELRPRLFVLGVGDDADVTLLRGLADDAHGALALVGEGGDDAFAAHALFDKLGGASYDHLDLTLPPAAGVDMVYADHETVFAGSAVTFYGRYLVPQPKATASLSAADRSGRAISQTFPAPLIAADASHPEIARGWAWRRVQDLLGRIREDGEKRTWVDEIVRLAKQYGFVTPYTSMLAASRSMLRPRNLQPGDPLLRIETDPGIRDVVALLPFGPALPLTYVRGEDLWETRFLAPTSMTDGTYRCTLILTDRDGRKYREEKSFIIDSRPPSVKAALASYVVRPGDALPIVAHADADTRTLRARIDDGPGVALRWSATAKASTGTLVVPGDLTSGPHEVVLVAEDFAHNTTIVRIPIAVVVGGRP